MAKRQYLKPVAATIAVIEPTLLTASGDEDSVQTEVIEQEGLQPPQGWTPGL